MRRMKSVPSVDEEDCEVDAVGRRVRDRRAAAMTRAWRKFCMYNKDGALKKNGGGSVFGGSVGVSSVACSSLLADIDLVGRLHMTGDVDPRACTRRNIHLSCNELFAPT